MYKIILQHFNLLNHNSFPTIFMQTFANNTAKLLFCPGPSHCTFLQVTAFDLHQDTEHLGHHLKFHEILKQVVNLVATFVPNYFVIDHNFA